jgi:hypothetical protein
MARLLRRRSRSLLICFATMKDFSSNMIFSFAFGKKNTATLRTRII